MHDPRAFSLWPCPQRRRLTADTTTTWRKIAETPSADLAVTAFSVVGPRNRVDKIVKRLDLLT